MTELERNDIAKAAWTVGWVPAETSGRPDDYWNVFDPEAELERFVPCYSENHEGDSLAMLRALVAILGDGYIWHLSEVGSEVTASIVRFGGQDTSYVAWEATGPTVATAVVRCVLASAEDSP